jgi:hypothetical protein
MRHNSGEGDSLFLAEHPHAGLFSLSTPDNEKSPVNALRRKGLRAFVGFVAPGPPAQRIGARDNECPRGEAVRGQRKKGGSASAKRDGAEWHGLSA